MIWYEVFNCSGIHSLFDILYGLGHLQIFWKCLGTWLRNFSGKLQLQPTSRRLDPDSLTSRKGTRTVVLRFLKIITSAKCVIPLYDYDGNIMQPEEGEPSSKIFLPFTRNTVELDQVTCSASVNIDKKGVLVRGLRLLCDTTTFSMDSDVCKQG